MAEIITVTVPDIGDFKEVEVIEVLVAPGDTVAPEASLITLESDKASMEIPAPQGGTVKELMVKVGDRVAQGTPILTLEAEAAVAPAPAAQAPAKPEAAPTAAPAPAVETGDADIETDVLVLGSGPGGYTAAFRAADLGKKVVLVERHAVIGGVCLNVGCIPSKALLHTAQVINEAAEFAEHGVSFGKPKIDLDAIRAYKDGIIGKLTGGLAQLVKQRKVQIVHGEGRFTSPHTLAVETAEGSRLIRFQQAIIAAGSRVAKLPFVPWDDPRVMDSTDALELQEVPKRLLVIGGGIIGLEMATVYHALGAKVTVVELADGLIPGADRDIVRPLEKRIKARYENIFLQTQVTAVEPDKKGLLCRFKGDKAPAEDVFDRVLVAVGRAPNGKLIGAEAAGVAVDERGFIAVDSQQRTNVPHIFAIGDIVGQPMLAHKATHEGKVAAEVIAGQKVHFDARTIPSVAYTDPEVAWMGLTETEAKGQGIAYEKGAFPWAASGRSLSLGRDEGLTKVLFDPDTHRVLGAGIVGPNAGELIAEAVLALEMDAEAGDLALAVHPHPTLSETLNFAAEAAEGTITDLYIPKRR
ncbi:dihydrolipoyl dehydrogenase [Acidihalobacter aeolianus]|uniref:Dihydrolipoyl dehydrogenase n=1 Tax=Acidihalobacter aeolianus TaxID=2792603 RepID=A0A1D8K9U2_9GAMM|nr:dihydrolipoyl dehydrogenase [Acidihalobacter aeolianus]AOV17701.1 dihydrolipoyl dehydrogenase [Acidihalobacter aeolianus]